MVCRNGLRYDAALQRSHRISGRVQSRAPAAKQIDRACRKSDGTSLSGPWQPARTRADRHVSALQLQLGYPQGVAAVRSGYPQGASQLVGAAVRVRASRRTAEAVVALAADPVRVRAEPDALARVPAPAELHQRVSLAAARDLESGGCSCKGRPCLTCCASCAQVEEDWTGAQVLCSSVYDTWWGGRGARGNNEVIRAVTTDGCLCLLRGLRWV